jgi:Holliday junction resolvase-like predicted endonuclease
MKHKQGILITKASGDKVPFDASQLRRSLERSKAEPAAINAVVQSITAMLYEGMTTREIYKKAFGLLRKHSRSTAARYKLKNAIMELGPAGFAFEKFIAALLKAEGYKAHTGEIVQGKCVTHEVDVIAERGNVRCMIECKFHGNKGNYSDVKVPLYIRSRFVDVAQGWDANPEYQGKHFEGWVVTNTRFTTDAEQYGTCVGLELVSWDTPKGNSIKERIDRSGLHPVTSLTSISLAEKKTLLDMDVVLCSDLIKTPQLLGKVGVSKRRMKRVEKELAQLCAH